MRFMQYVKPLSRFFRPAEAPPPPPGLEPSPLAAPESVAVTVAVALGSDTAASREPSRVRLAQMRLAQLIDDGSVDFATLPTAIDESSLLSVAALCRDPRHLSLTLSRLSDARQLAQLVTDGSSSRLRQAAAQSIEDPAELRRLLKQMRGKDNGAYKIIKQKCDEIRAQEQRRIEIENSVNAACAALERQGHRLYDPLYEAAFRLSEADWRAVETQASPELRERAARAVERCREVIAQHVRQLAESAAEKNQRAAVQAGRQEALTQAAADAEQRSEEAKLAATAAAEVREAEHKAQTAVREAELSALRQLGGLIGKAHGALRDGNTGRAAGLRRAIEEKRVTLPTLPAYLTGQLQQLDLRLQELKQWKDFAVAPKRLELIEEMESLIGSNEEPTVLADRIKQLQDDWKTISAGIVSDSEADWQRFHQAAQTAYQPCREHFEAQARERRENAEKRMELTERLRAFETTQIEQPNFRAIGVVLQEARQEWRRHFPVDRASAAITQREFEAALGRLQGRLDGWQASNASDKRALILRAQQLLALSDSREAVDAMKGLQQAWRKIGTAPRDQEQRLWNEFREQCDAVFQKRQHAYAEYTAGLEASKTQGLAICEEVEKTAALPGAELLAAAAHVSGWREAFDALGEMPRADQRGLHERFERALSRYQAQMSHYRAREVTQSFVDLLEAGRHIHTYGWRVAEGAPSAELERLETTAEEYIAGIARLPRGAAEALEEAWGKAHAATLEESAAHERDLRMLCIRAEILSDRATPVNDQPLRREYQVQRLVKHMGQREAQADDLDTLALAWVRVGPAAPAILEESLNRLRRCRESTESG